MNGDRFRWNTALRIAVGMPNMPRNTAAAQLHATNLDDAMAGMNVEPGRLGIDGDFFHSSLPFAVLMPQVAASANL